MSKNHPNPVQVIQVGDKAMLQHNGVILFSGKTGKPDLFPWHEVMMADRGRDCALLNVVKVLTGVSTPTLVN